MTLDRYGVQDAEGHASDWMTEDYEEAKRQAQDVRGVVIVYEFEYADSYLDEHADYRERGDEEGD